MTSDETVMSQVPRLKQTADRKLSIAEKTKSKKLETARLRQQLANRLLNILNG